MASRNWVKLDRYALSDVSREYHLTSVELVVLFALITLADFRTWEWRGTSIELAEHAPPSRSSTVKACKRLAEVGLVSIQQDFHQNSVGRMRIDCYDRVIVPPARSTTTEPPIKRSPPTVDRTPTALQSTSKRPRFVQSRAFHLGNEGSPRDHGEEGVGSVGRCSNCQKPLSGSIVGEICACPF